MTALAQGAAGLAVALSLALLATPRIGAAAALCAMQAVVVAIAALAQHHPWVAGVQLLVAAAIPLAPRFLASQRAPPAPSAIVGLLAGGVLALLTVTLPDTGLALAVTLLGAALVAVRRSPVSQVLGLASLHSGIVLAALGAGPGAPVLALAALPVLPALGAAGLWLGAHRARLAALTSWPAATWIDAVGCTAVLVLARALLWQVTIDWPPLRLDALAVGMIVVLALVATATGWARRRDTTGPACPGARLVLLAGAALAILSNVPILTWLALAIATMGAVAAALPRRSEAWRRLCLGGIALGLALFGAIGSAADLWGPGAVCAVVGIGGLGWLAPELALTAAALILRHRGVLRAMPDLAAPVPLLLVAGLAAMTIAAIALQTPGDAQRLPRLTGFGQAGVAVFAFGLGTPEATGAGLLHLALLALTQSAVLLGRGGSLERLAAVAGLAGVPPFGPFPSLLLVLVATAGAAAWLLPPLLLGLAALGWPVLARLPSPRPLRPSLRPQLAWIPLALLLLAGFAMPEPGFTWLRAVAMQAR